MPALLGSATKEANAAATVASIALPPRSSASRPALAACALPAETTPLLEVTVDRVADIWLSRGSPVRCDIAIRSWQHSRRTAHQDVPGRLLRTTRANPIVSVPPGASSR